VVNAVVDALSPFGVRNVDMPLTPNKIWRLMREHGVEA
jgi:carbon-monoxide dehydrogenase large subunit